MGALIDIIGKKYGKLTVINRSKLNDKYNKPVWECLCDCGNPKFVKASTSDIKSGKIKSCGCLRHNKNKKNKTKSNREITRDSLIGKKFQTNQNCVVRIIQIESSKMVTIEFEDEFKYRTIVEYGNLIKGSVKNPYYKFLYNKGYLGVGKYRATINGKADKIYDAWRKMFDRCYSDAYHKKEPTYIGCTVDPRWYDFQTFAKWYEENNYCITSIPHLDKDLMFLNNKTYSPETCCIIPNHINCCMGLRKSKSNNLPVGVRFRNNKYVVYTSIDGKYVNLGNYSKLYDAMKAYKKARIDRIKNLADRYKKEISEVVYQRMYDYENRFVEEFEEYATI